MDIWIHKVTKPIKLPELFRKPYTIFIYIKMSPVLYRVILFSDHVLHFNFLGPEVSFVILFMPCNSNKTLYKLSFHLFFLTFLPGMKMSNPIFPLTDQDYCYFDNFVQFKINTSRFCLQTS